MADPLTFSIDEVREEIEDLHRFFDAWFRGELPNDSQYFKTHCLDRFLDGFCNIQPAGKLLEHGALAESIAPAHGFNPDFKIWIENVQIRATWDDTCVATYEEHQTGAKNSQATNVRISTVIFRKQENRLKWQWVHETGLS